jgi:CheY-like chemotaxis protein
VVAVIDNDDDFRRAALRCVRRVDMNGVGLLDTAAAMRWLASTKPAVVIVPRERAGEAVRACASLPVDERPRIIATCNDAAHGRIDVVDAVLPKPLVDSALVALLTQTATPPTTIERKKRVLLVDDDDDIRETFSILLEDEGYEVVPAPHGKAAWNALQGGLRPDVILLDLMMPVMTGQEMFDRLRSSPLSNTPVVVITAGTDAAPGPGAPILRKPIDMHDLLAAVSRAAA